MIGFGIGISTKRIRINKNKGTRRWRAKERQGKGDIGSQKIFFSRWKHNSVLRTCRGVARSESEAIRSRHVGCESRLFGNGDSVEPGAMDVGAAIGAAIEALGRKGNA